MPALSSALAQNDDAVRVAALLALMLAAWALVVALVAVAVVAYAWGAFG